MSTAKAPALQASKVPRLYTPDEVLAMTRVSWRTIQRWMDAKKNPFPEVRRLGSRTPVFIADSVDDWILKKIGE